MPTCARGVGEETFRNPLAAMRAVAADSDAEEAVRKSHEALGAPHLRCESAVLGTWLPGSAHVLGGVTSVQPTRPVLQALRRVGASIRCDYPPDVWNDLF
jgi:hypothetical protein